MSHRGFSLLEVLVAVALLALGLSGLFLAQARSLELSRQARQLSVATGLARSKLIDCEYDLRKKGFSIGDYDEEGNFDDDGFPEFFWECHGYQPDIPVGDAADIQEGLTSSGGGTPAGSLPGLGGGGGDNPMAEAGAGMIAQILAPISEVMGDAVRELTVVVRWRDGEDWMDMQVTTHLVDVQQMRPFAQQAQALAGQLNALTGGGAPGGATPPASPPGAVTPPGSITPIPPPSPRPGGSFR